MRHELPARHQLRDGHGLLGDLGRLNPLQLLLLGTSLELSYFVFQLPTGVLADLVSRRLCVLTGLFIVGAAQIMASLSPSFGNLVASWAVLGLGAALNNGAQDAWIADELSAEVGDDRMTGIYLRATQLGLIATVAGSLLSGVIALAGLDMPPARRRHADVLARGGGRVRDARAELPASGPGLAQVSAASSGRLAPRWRDRRGPRTAR